MLRWAGSELCVDEKACFHLSVHLLVELTVVSFVFADGQHIDRRAVLLY